MQENSRRSADGEKPGMTVGIDLGDRFSRYCVLNQEGEVIEEGRVQTTMTALERHFTGERQRIAMECGTHSPWVSRLLQGMGHEVVVANARKVRAITGSESKNDRNDAEKLARFAAYDVRLLSPIQHRSPERQRDLNLLQARDTAGPGTDHAGECHARVGEERWATTAKVFDGIVCQGSADNDSRGHGASAHAVVRASSEFDGADPEDGPTDRSTGETISRSRQVTERARRGAGGCSGVRVDAGLTWASGKEPGSGRLPGITAAAKPVGGVRSPATDQ